MSQLDPDTVEVASVESAQARGGSVDRVNLITADSNVDELVTQHPATARVFVRRRMACIGCDIARFESVAEVCQVYHQPVATVLEELRQAVTEARALNAQHRRSSRNRRKMFHAEQAHRGA
jgi:hybrid cluster-associated redox disulfide protein